jgi:hypothetical protein
MSDSNKIEASEAQALQDDQLEEAKGGLDVYRIFNAKDVLTTSRLRDVLSRFRDKNLLGDRLRPFDRGSLLDVPTSN